MTEELGRAELETGVNLAGLDKDLVKAEARVMKSVAVMQAMLDSLHADINVRLNEADVLAGKLAAATQNMPGAGGSPIVVQHRAGTTGGRSGVEGLVGIRGPNQAGSLSNPLVFVQAAAKYFPMGSYGAAIGEDNAADAQRGDQSSGVASAADMAALTQAVGELSSNMAPGSQLAIAGGNGITEPGGGDRTVASLDRQNSDALQRAAAALDRQTAHGSPTGRSGTTIIETDHVVVQGSAGSGTSGFAGKGSSSSTGGAPVAFGGSGGGGGGRGGPPIAAGFPGGGGGGDRNVHIFHHSEGGSGGGGSRILRRPFGGRRSEPDTGSVFSLANLFKGDQGRGGAFGLPGFGSVGSLAGLGLEHFLLSALGIGASATSAVGGAALLGSASLTSTLVGSGSNALVNKATETQIAATTKDFYALQTAIAEYGKGSKQAVAAQNLFNYSIKQMGDAAPAELKVFRDVKNIHSLFEKDSTAARIQSAENMDAIVKLGTVFTPLVTAAAAKNLAIINTGLHPLFQWLEGPQGIGIFEDLENHFAKDLPTSIHAFDMGVEDFLRLMDVAVQYTGGLSKALDNIFTAKNGESTQQYRAEVEKLVGDFDRWKKLLTVLGTDLRLIFHQDAGTANSIVDDLTRMLVKLEAWERSTTGQTELQNIFFVHKQEIIQLLDLLSPLSSAYGHFYMDVAPPLVRALTDIAGAVDKIMTAIEKIPGGADALGLTIILGKLGILSKLGPGLMTAARAMGLMGKGGVAAAAESAAGVEGGAAAAGAYKGIPKLLAKVGTVGASGEGAAFAAEGIAATATAAIPIILAGAGGAAILAFAAHAIGEHFGTKATATPGQVTGLPTQQQALSGTGRGLAVNADQGAGTLKDAELDIQSVGKFSNYSAAQLRDLIKAIKQAGSVKLNGVKETKQEVLELADAALKVKEKWNAGFNSAFRDVNLFYRNSSRSLSSLKDDFQSNMNRIVDTVGTGSEAGRKLMATNVNKMVLAVTDGMGDGKISVQHGIAAINEALKEGMATGAVSWQQAWTTRFNVVTDLFNANKIDTRQYYADVRSLTNDGDQHIQADVKATYEGIVANLRKQLNAGEITHQQFVKRVHAADQQMGTQAQSDMADFAAQIVGGFASVSKASGEGLTDMIKSVNSALKLLGQKPLTGLQVAVMSTNAANTTPGGQKHGASGGVFQIGRPGEAGRDSVPLKVGSTEIMVAPGEQAMVANRHQIPMLNYAVARTFGYNGLPGFFAANNKPNYMAGGGFVADPGTIQNVGQLPQITGNLNRLGQAEGLTIYGISGYRSPAHSVEVGGFADDPHTRGEAEDVGVDSQLRASAARISTALLHKFNLDRPFDESDDPGNSEVNHIQLLAGSVGGAIAGALGGGTLGSLISQIATPGVKGGGPLGSMVHAALATVAKGANSFLGAKGPSGVAGASMAGIAPGSWLQVAKQIAARFGWGPGQVQDWEGVEDVEDSSYSLTATNPGSGAYGLAQGITGPGWYYGEGGNPNTLVGQLTGMGNYIHGRYGDPAGALAHEREFDWYAGGGMVGGYAGGGLPKSSLSMREQAFIRANKGKSKKKAHAPKKGKPLGASFTTPSSKGTIGGAGPFPFDDSDLGPINSILNTILGLDGGQGGSLGGGGDAQSMSDLIQYYTNLWSSGLYPTPNFSSWQSPGDFVISQDANGNAITPFISPNINQVLQQLGGPGLPSILGYQSEWVGDLTGSDSMARELIGNKGLIQQAISRRVAMVKQIRARIQANVAKIKALRKKISDNQTLIAAEHAKKLPFANPKNKSQRNANTTFNANRSSRISGWNAQIKGWNAQIAPLENENKQLGGNPDSIGSGGELETITSQLGSAASSGGLGGGLAAVLGSGSSASGLYELMGIAQGWDTQLSATGGDIDTQRMQMQLYQQGLGGLMPGANSALAAAVASAATSSTANSNPLTGTVGFSFQGQQFAASLGAGIGMAMGGVVDSLANMPPYAGVFHGGGVIPGPVGSERMARVQAGETIVPIGAGGGADASGVTSAIDRLVQALGDHEQTVAANTQATSANTQAVSSTGGASRYSYGSAYAGSLSSDSIVNVGVGS